MTTVQLENPAQLGRKQRIIDFKEYVEANRQTKTEKQILATYSMQTGLSLRVLKLYLRIIYDAGFYVRPRFSTKFMILTQKEYDKVIAKVEAKKRQKEDNDLL